MLLQKDVRHLPKNYVKLPFKNKNSKEYHEHFDDFFHPLKTEMIDKYISSKYFVGELIYAITGKEASREINVKTDYAMSLLKYINYARVDALVDDIDIEWEQDKLKILSHYKPTTKKSFQYNSFKGYGGKVTYAHLMSLKRHVHSSIDVQGEYYEIYHGQGIRKAHYQTAICAEFANDAIEPDINAIFVNACNPKGINLVDKGKMTDSLGNIMGTTVTWYDFNIFMIDQLTTNTPPLREAFVWFFNTAHKEDLFLKTTSHITDSRARNLIEFIVTMMRDIKGIPG
ncbi:MAG: hypothetical protein LBT59_07585, partial [Clostridiales bacterium]|nr:hypothetical protein [Clostridiales bacterium]